MASFKLPEYFTKTPPGRWDIVSFLEQESKLKGDDYDHNKATGSWLTSLLHLQSHDDPEITECATKKIAKYYEHPSDRMAAKNWYGKQKRRKAKAGARAKESRRTTTKNIYNGPVNNGPLYDSTLNLNHTSGNPISAGHHRDTIGGSSIGASSLGSADSSSCSLREDGNRSNYSGITTENTVDGGGGIGVDEVDFDETKANEEEDNEDSQLQDARNGLRQVHGKMVGKFQLTSGRFLEDCLYDYAMELTELSPAHFCIAGSDMLSTLSDHERQLILSRVLSLPSFPAELDNSLSRYNNVTTTAQCRIIARDSLDDRDVFWIDDVLRHVVELITDSGDILLHDNLNEGVWDCLVYPPFWDKYLINIPDMLLQRKEITLLANEYEPYPYLTYEARYDGVVQTRTSRRERSNRYELCVFEVSSKFDGVRSKKWKKDRTKLLAGCRAMLYHLQSLVNYDVEMMTKLQVVGVLQGGRWTQVFIMSCINRNVFYLRQGGVREFPTTLEGLPLVYDIISNVWKVKRVITDTALALKTYFQEKEKEKEESDRQCRTDADFL